METIWTHSEVELLKSNYLKMTDKELSNILNKNEKQIKCKRDHLKLARNLPRPIIDWKPIEKEYLRNKNIDDISNKFNVKSKSLINHLKIVGIYEYENKRWSEEEISYIKNNIDKLSNIDIAKTLNVSVSSLVAISRKHHLPTNTSIYYCDNYSFKNEELFIYNQIKQRIDKKELIDSISVKDIFKGYNPGHYLFDIYGFGYEGYLRTFFNIDYKDHILENCKKIYDLYLKGSIQQPPNDFYSMNILRIIGRYVFDDILKWTKEDFYTKFSTKILKKFRLRNWLREIDMSIFDFVIFIYPEYNNMPHLFKMCSCPNGYWEDINNRFKAVDFMVENLITTKIIQSVDDVLKLSSDVLKKNNLGGLLCGRLMYDILSEYLFLKTGKKYNEWEFNFVTNGYWKDINNVKKVVKWMLEEKEGWDGKDIEWIKNNYGINLYNKYNLHSLLTGSRMNGIDSSLNNLFFMTYSDLNIFPWEFNTVTKHFWTKSNSDLAFKQLIENRLKLNLDDIPKYISKSYFQYNYSKFIAPLNKYYNGNIFSWINSIYPKRFNCRDFGYIECLDGTIVKSLAEQMIHNFLISKYNNVRYVTNENGNKGIYKNTKYVPDWIINDNIIVEYFGLYKNGKKDNIEIFKQYDIKTKEKLKISKNSNLIFIFLYDLDLKNNLNGLHKKFTDLDQQNILEKAN